MDLNLLREIEALVDKKFKSFSKRIGDTPTDALQLVNKKYVDAHMSSVAGGSPGGANTDIQYNDSGVFGGSADFIWDNVQKNLYLSGNVSILPKDNTSADGDPLGIESGTSTFTDGSGGLLLIAGGDGNGAGAGANVDIFAGNPGATGNGGNVTITSGPGGFTSGSPGATQIAGGNAQGGNTQGGGASLTAGNGHGTFPGGQIDITAGTGGATGDGGQLNLSAGNAGASGGSGGDVSIAPGTLGSGGVNGTLLFRNGTNNASSQRVMGHMTTTDGSLHSVPDSFAMGAHSSGYIRARVVGHRTGGSAGTVDDSFAAELVVGVKCTTSAVLQTAITYVYFFGDQGGWNAQFVASGSSIFLQVVGAINNNVSWTYELWYTQVLI